MSVIKISDIDHVLDACLVTMYNKLYMVRKL